MNATEALEAGTPRKGHWKLDGWKAAVASFGMVATAPVLFLVFLLLLGSVLPLVIFGAPFVFPKPERGSRPPLAPAKMREAPRTLPAPSPA